jgi:hypothetical protein
MFQFHSSYHQAVYVKSIKANHIPAVKLKLKWISGRYLSLTYQCTEVVHINERLQNTYFTKLNNEVT